MSGIHKMGMKVGEGKDDEDFVPFSIRIPRNLAEQIDARRAISKRSRNMEITLLLERQIDAEVERDKKMMERVAEMNLNPKSNQS